MTPEEKRELLANYDRLTEAERVLFIANLFYGDAQILAQALLERMEQKINNGGMENVID